VERRDRAGAGIKEPDLSMPDLSIGTGFKYKKIPD
jgi:hypothetical protein